MSANKTKYLIKFPQSRVLLDPGTREAIQSSDGKHQMISGRLFLGRVFAHTLWQKGDAEAEAQGEILLAHDDQPEGFWLEGSIYKYLREACEEKTRNYQIGGHQGPTITWFGYPPALASQVLPFIKAVLQARTEAEIEATKAEARAAVEAEAKARANGASEVEA